MNSGLKRRRAPRRARRRDDATTSRPRRISWSAAGAGRAAGSSEISIVPMPEHGHDAEQRLGADRGRRDPDVVGVDEPGDEHPEDQAEHGRRAPVRRAASGTATRCRARWRPRPLRGAVGPSLCTSRRCRSTGGGSARVVEQPVPGRPDGEGDGGDRPERDQDAPGPGSRECRAAGSGSGAGAQPDEDVEEHRRRDQRRPTGVKPATTPTAPTTIATGDDHGADRQTSRARNRRGSSSRRAEHQPDQQQAAGDRRPATASSCPADPGGSRSSKVCRRAAQRADVVDLDRPVEDQVEARARPRTSSTWSRLTVAAVRAVAGAALEEGAGPHGLPDQPGVDDDEVDVVVQDQLERPLVERVAR